MSSDQLREFIRGATSGAMDWTEDKVKELALRFKHRDVAFLQDVEVIDIALNQRKTSEWMLFQQNVADAKLRVLYQMGLTLRGIEDNAEKCKSARDKIVRRYGTNGLHIAQFVQNGVFAKFIASYLERALTPEEMKQEIDNLFKNIEVTNSFVQVSDDVGREAEKIVVRIQSHAPNTYVISGLRSVKEKCNEILAKVMARIDGYTPEIYTTDFKIMIFLHKVAA
jgi:hypothetical protein